MRLHFAENRRSTLQGGAHPRGKEAVEHGLQRIAPTLHRKVSLTLAPNLKALASTSTALHHKLQWQGCGSSSTASLTAIRSQSGGGGGFLVAMGWLLWNNWTARNCGSLCLRCHDSRERPKRSSRIWLAAPPSSSTDPKRTVTHWDDPSKQPKGGCSVAPRVCGHSNKSLTLWVRILTKFLYWQWGCLHSRGRHSGV